MLSDGKVNRDLKTRMRWRRDFGDTEVRLEKLLCTPRVRSRCGD